MADKMIENNQVVIMGEIVSPFTFSHQVFGEGFYLVDVMVKRLSESQDIIPVMVSERLVDVSQDYQGEWICISGQFRSYNRHEEKRTIPSNPTRFTSMDTYVNRRSTGKHLWEERSPTF